MKKPLLQIVIAFVLLFFSAASFAQAPDLSSAASFVLFSSNGTIINTGTSLLTGNAGTQSGFIRGFGNVNGVIHHNDEASATCADDLQKVYNELNAAVPTFFQAPFLGNGDSLKPGVYSITGSSLLNQTLTLDAGANTNAVFIFKIQGTFASVGNAKINLINGAKACNVFWKVEGSVDLAAGTVMKGTVIANNASVNIQTGVSLEGRVFSTSGNVAVDAINACTPINTASPLLTGPAAPVFASAKKYVLFSGNGGVINTGTTVVKGDVGTNVGVAAGYEPADVSGIIHTIPDSSTAACAAELLNTYNYLDNLSSDIELLYPADFGNNLILTPHTYLLNTATALTDTLYLNAQGNANAVFVIKVNGALSTGTYSKILLINQAQASNVYWLVDGAVNLNDYTDFKGTIICNGAINLNSGTELNGRALTTNGALNTADITAPMLLTGNTSHAVYTWIGGNGAWNEGSNWSSDGQPGVPSGCEADVIIPSGLPSVTSGVSAGNVNISTGINISSEGSLSVCGNLTGDRGVTAMIAGAGKVKLSGSTPQTVSGNISVSNLELNNAAGASIDTGSILSISGVYVPAAGTLVTNGGLVLKSSQTGTAAVANGNGQYIAGAVTIERYIPAKRAWWLLTAPVTTNTTQTINDAWQEGAPLCTINPFPGCGTHITGGSAANGFDQSPSNSASIKYLDKSWINLSNTKTTPVTQYNGYLLFVRGNRSYDISNPSSLIPPSETILRVKGELNQGEKTLTFNNPAANQFILAGNPYAAPVDFKTITKANVKNSFWAWDSRRSGTSSGGYVTVSWDAFEGDYDIDYSPAQTAQTQIIQSGQAVLLQVQNSNTATSVTFNETDKISSGNSNGFFRGAGTDLIQQLRITLNRNSGAATVAVDGALAKYSKGYSSGTGDDAIKLSNNDENLSFKRNGLKLSIERRPTISLNDTLFVNIDALKANNDYSFEFNGSNFEGQPFSATLIDNYLGLQTPAGLTTTSNINFKVDGNPASADPTRFMVIFRPLLSLPIDLSGIKAWQNNQGVLVEWDVQNETGVQHYIVEKSADMQAFVKVSSIAARNNNKAETYNCTDITPFEGDNFYRIKIIDNSGEIKYSNVVKVRLAKAEPSFSIYPNPVTDKKATIQLVNLPRGSYNLFVYDQNGRQLLFKKINDYENFLSQAILLPNQTPPGTYQFVIKGIDNGITLKQAVLIQ